MALLGKAHFPVHTCMAKFSWKTHTRKKNQKIIQNTLKKYDDAIKLFEDTKLLITENS